MCVCLCFPNFCEFSSFEFSVPCSLSHTVLVNWASEPLYNTLLILVGIRKFNINKKIPLDSYIRICGTNANNPKVKGDYFVAYGGKTEQKTWTHRSSHRHSSSTPVISIICSTSHEIALSVFGIPQSV